jgi:hypothetical protein
MCVDITKSLQGNLEILAGSRLDDLTVQQMGYYRKNEKSLGACHLIAGFNQRQEN